MQDQRNDVGRRKRWIGLAGWLTLVFVAAAIGAAASANAGSFYDGLVRPSWSPPGWLFGPVWSMLYVLMGISAWLVWDEHGFSQARIGLTLFFVQLTVNALWSWLFFFWYQGTLAFLDVILLWLLIAAIVRSYWKLSARTAALLLLPYLAWVTFAAFLNYTIWQLNPGLLS